MQKQLIIGLVSLLAICQANAQRSSSVDFSIGQGKNVTLLSASYQKLYFFGKKDKLIAGFGLRINDNFGQNKAFVTAPASVSEGNFFKKQNETKLDTLYLPNHNTLSVNLGIYLGFKLSEKVSLEFNIDAVGLSLGKQQTGTYMALSQKYAKTTQAVANPTRFNLLLTGDYDLGSLNSEFFAKIKLGEKISLKAGTTFVFTEYTTTKTLAFANDRFRNKSLMPMIGIRYSL